MPNLLRAALTAAVLAAIAVRLRRRARLPRSGAAEPAPPPAAAPVSRPRRRLRRLGVLVAGVTAVLCAVALLGPGSWPWQSRPGASAPTSGAEGHTTPDPDRTTPSASPDQGQAAPSASPGQGASFVPPGPHELTTEELAVREAGLAGTACGPPSGAVTVRPVDPRVRRAVDRQWRRIERWLRANAPKTYAALGRPGRARTIAVAEAQMGVEFPDDLRASLLRHDGARGFGFGGAVNLGARQIRDAWRLMCAGDVTAPPDGGWHGRLIPFGRLPGRGGYAVVDSAGGAAIRHPSYHALMRAVADALETGTPLDGRHPTVKRGTLRWAHTR